MIKIVDIYLIYELKIFSEKEKYNKDGLFEIHYLKDNKLSKFYVYIFFHRNDKDYSVQHHDYSHDINETTKYFVNYEMKDFSKFIKVFEKQKLKNFNKENIEHISTLIKIYLKNI